MRRKTQNPNSTRAFFGSENKRLCQLAANYRLMQFDPDTLMYAWYEVARREEADASSGVRRNSVGVRQDRELESDARRW